MMNCDDHQENASRFMDGELEASEQAGLFAHLSSCPECRSFLATSVRAREVMRKSPASLPEGIDDELFERLSNHPLLRPAIHDRPPSFWHREIILSYPLAAAALILVVLASLLFSLLSVRTNSGSNRLETILGRGQAGRQTVVVVYQLPEEQVIVPAPTHLMEVRARTVQN
jgi:anti-sigma factor RsiW